MEINKQKGSKMQINGLSKREVNFLHMIWSFQGEEEFLEWFVALNERDRMTVESLMVLLNHELTEEMFMQQEEYPEAYEYLKRFMLNGHV